MLLSIFSLLLLSAIFQSYNAVYIEKTSTNPYKLYLEDFAKKSQSTIISSGIFAERVILFSFTINATLLVEYTFVESMDGITINFLPITYEIYFPISIAVPPPSATIKFILLGNSLIFSSKI